MKPLFRPLLITLIAVGAFLLSPMSAIAQDLAPTSPLVDTQGAAYQEVIPDFSTLSFRDLGGVEQGGRVNFEYDGETYSRQWNAGDSLGDILTLGDVAPLGGQSFSLGQVGALTGTDVTSAPLADYALVTEGQTLQNLSDTVPYLGDFKVEEVAPVQQLLSEQTGRLDFGDETISQVLAGNPGLSDIKLSDTALGRFQVGDLPNVDTTQIGRFENWDTATINDVPGLEDVPLSGFPQGIFGLNGVISRIDLAWGTAESDRNNTISGSYQAGFAVPCPDGGKLTGFDSPYEAPEANDPVECAHIALDDLENEGREAQSSFEGKQWISGKYHEVECGFGPLKFVPSPLGYSVGYEPTGRHPFGDMFKVVVWEPDERSDQISFKLFFRWCTYIPGIGRTCTPYNQFSTPWLDYQVNALLYVGPLDGQGGGSVAPASPTGVPGAGALNSTLGPCSGQRLGNIDLDRFANSLAAIESRGSGNYQAVGVFVQTRYASGRALGRYQMMSYLPEVQAEVSQVSGGQAWLNKIEGGYRPSPAEINRYFPEPAQERAFRAEINQLVERAQGEIDPQTGRPFAGDRLIERVGQMWFGGPGSAIDGGGSDAFGRLTLYDYGVEVLAGYKSGSGSSPQGCVPPTGEGSGEATGQFANPAAGYPLTSDFGPRPRPCAGCSAYHPAVDLGTPTGTPINASDGGEVVYVDYAGGYGKTVVIDHGNGYQSRYSHLNAYNVSVGTQVDQGQQIATSGSTGNGTGPHLDFGIYQNSGSNFPPKGTAVDPENFINF
jgi:murein DD-endopeptidase MepM/ murein hydrolase activator NlpD